MKKQIKKSFFLLGAAVISVILHNAFFALFKVEEPVFFTLTFVFAAAFIVFFVYGIFKKEKSNQLIHGKD